MNAKKLKEGCIMKKLKAILGFSLSIFILFVTASNVNAITAWGRKYGVSCNVCHIAGYKLTYAGQQFLRHGHQLPGAESKEANMSDYFSITMKIRAWDKNTTVQQSGTADAITTKNSFEAHALSVYSGGPLDSGFTYFTEMYLHENERKNPAENYEATESDMGDWARSKLAEAYLQYGYEKDDLYFTARAGRIMPWLIHLHGGGARLEYSRPLPLTSTVGDNPYRPFSRQFGVGAGVGYGELFFEAGVVNGTGKYENTVEIGTDKAKDIYASLDYSIGDNGSMVGLYYYNGQYPLDLSYIQKDLTTLKKAETADKFNQIGIMGQYVAEYGALIAAYFNGSDSYTPLNGTSETTYKSQSYYAELQGYFNDGALSPYLRWEYFDPDTDKSDSSEKSGPVLGIHWKPFEHGRFVLEASNYTTANSSTKKTIERDITLEVQFMF
ncbi:MAG: hypothetical protein A3I04_05015 [Nitrospinae bacterium RIFCSPLOWO2_02_FULL_39_110]|nr:MAG: hypothetical protein A2W53_05745 [Nitrospinae bacterium RIFCSPHIGHO2_02_39_11]OGV98502.1 MAG: hypothetical protein A3D97_04075 [Nitrospinae bacterium RIFCSPHIGHO2_12_FULL_39_42]OGW00488.1 MAG: hypothetical protein A3D20_05045 [Nitrospinae bacterium RIFCSPHIGHO2_02_FULL_39_82]OGW04885.1 MAG: hypothetical protein A3I04_05015 [Nitrospinae bacterium RIFCSPLOWO2_02_FULL_39_110]OGW07606.1 MAG: hypothetical protein A2Z59_07640 [Nitrospinae bacterium RIFCSPLOWO2_02_39_17]OGW09290.1 MAG: hypoth